MDHFAGLDVSVKETSVCILDDAGKIVKEVKVASEPQADIEPRAKPTASIENDPTETSLPLIKLLHVGVNRFRLQVFEFCCYFAFSKKQCH